MKEIVILHPALPTVSRREICRYAGMHTPTPDAEALIDRVIGKTKPRLQARLCYRAFQVQRAGEAYAFFDHAVASKTLDRTLSKCSHGVVFALTMGLDADRAIARAMAESTAEALLTEAYCTACVEAICDDFCKGFSHSRPRVSPGYGDLPLELQHRIFAQLCPEKHIGLHLNQSLLMSPSKSVTAIFGIEEET